MGNIVCRTRKERWMMNDENPCEKGTFAEGKVEVPFYGLVLVKVDTVVHAIILRTRMYALVNL